MPSASDPKQSPAYRAAKLAVIILSTLIVLALIALVVGAAMKLGGLGHNMGRGTAGTAPGTAIETALPPGARITGSESRDGRLILHVKAADHEEIEIIDIQSGRLIGRVTTMPAKP